MNGVESTPMMTRPPSNSAQDVTRRERSLDGVELVAAPLGEARGGLRVEVGAERDDQQIGLERPVVGLDATGRRVDRVDLRLDEVHSRFDGITVRVPHGLGRRAPEHDVELGEPEHERVVAVDQRDVDVIAERFRQAGGELEAAEPGPQDEYAHTANILDTSRQDCATRRAGFGRIDPPSPRIDQDRRSARWTPHLRWRHIDTESTRDAEKGHV